MIAWHQQLLNSIAIHYTEYNTIISPFPIIKVEDKPLLIHLISIDQNLHKISPNHFSKISEQAAAQNLKCIHLWEDNWFQHPVLISNRLKALMNQSQKIHGRETITKRIDKQIATVFLQANHLQQWANAYYKFGLYNKKNELLAVATFSKSRVMIDGVIPYRSYELIRFASKSGITVVGGLSKLLSFFINQYQPAHLMTYADRDWSLGESYQKIGFKNVGYKMDETYWVHPNQLIRNKAKPLTEQEYAQKGFLPIYTSGSIKYVLDRRT